MHTTEALRRRQRAAAAAKVPDSAAERIRALEQIEEAEVELRARRDPDSDPAAAEQLRRDQFRRDQPADQVREASKDSIVGFFSKFFGSASH